MRVYLKTTTALIFCLMFSLSVCAESNEPVSVYRLYNTKTGDHFYTVSEDEVFDATTSWHSPYTRESIAFEIYKFKQPGTTEVYRLYHKTTGDHFYTAGETEKDNAIFNLGYETEGRLGWAFNYQAEGTVPIYRMYNKKNKDHFYTQNKDETEIATIYGKYYVEGIAFYAYP